MFDPFILKRNISAANQGLTLLVGGFHRRGSPVVQYRRVQSLFWLCSGFPFADRDVGADRLMPSKVDAAYITLWSLRELGFLSD